MIRISRLPKRLPPPPDPSEEEIAERAAAIREEWTDEEMQRRCPHQRPVGMVVEVRAMIHMEAE